MNRSIQDYLEFRIIHSEDARNISFETLWAGRLKVVGENVRDSAFSLIKEAVHENVEFDATNIFAIRIIPWQI